MQAMGLLNPSHADGWNFKDATVEGLDRMVDGYAAQVNAARDMLRTLEKGQLRMGKVVPDIDKVRLARLALDERIMNVFDRLVTAAEQQQQGASSPLVATLLEDEKSDLFSHIKKQNLKELVTSGYAACGFPLGATDLFRK